MNMLIVTTVLRLVLAGCGVNVKAGPRKRLSRPRRLPCVGFGSFRTNDSNDSKHNDLSRRKRRPAAGDATTGHSSWSLLSEMTPK